MKFCAFEMDFGAGHGYEFWKDSIKPEGPYLAKYDKIGEVYQETILVKIEGPNGNSTARQLSVLCTTHFGGYAVLMPTVVVQKSIVFRMKNTD